MHFLISTSESAVSKLGKPMLICEIRTLTLSKLESFLRILSQALIDSPKVVSIRTYFSFLDSSTFFACLVSPLIAL